MRRPCSLSLVRARCRAALPKTRIGLAALARELGLDGLARRLGRGGLGALALALALGGCSDDPATPTAPAAAAGSPPVIVVVIDTLRADHLGTYGYPLDTSPVIDALAERCSVFESNSSQCNATFASITSLFTGLYPKTHQNYFAVSVPGQARANAGVATLAERLGRAGWQPLAVVSHPWWREAPVETAIGRGWEAFAPIPPEVTGVARRGEAGSAEATTDRALALLAQRDTGRPPFLWVHYFDPHTPYAPPPEQGDRFLHAHLEQAGLLAFEDRLRALDPAARSDWIGAHASSTEQRDALRLASNRALYDGEIADCDEQLGRLLGRLDADGLLEPALLVVLADHGENLDASRPGIAFSHARLYEGVVRVPLLVKRPGQRTGARVTALSQTIDVLPTLLELLGMPRDGALEGRSLVPLLDDPGGRLHERVFSESSDHVERMLRTDEWKLTDPGTGERAEMYRWRRDPDELHDLLASADDDERSSGTVVELARALDAFRPRHALQLDLYPDARPYELELALSLRDTRITAVHGPLSAVGAHGVAGSVRVEREPLRITLDLDRIMVEGTLDLARAGDAALAQRVLLGSTPIDATHVSPRWIPRGPAPASPVVRWRSTDDLRSLWIAPAAADRARVLLLRAPAGAEPELLSSTGFLPPELREEGRQRQLRAEPCDDAELLLRMPTDSDVTLLLDGRWPAAERVAWGDQGVASDRLALWIPRDGEVGAALAGAPPREPPPGAVVLRLVPSDAAEAIDQQALDAEQLEELRALGYVR